MQQKDVRSSAAQKGRFVDLLGEDSEQECSKPSTAGSSAKQDFVTTYNPYAQFLDGSPCKKQYEDFASFVQESVQTVLQNLEVEEYPAICTYLFQKLPAQNFPDNDSHLLSLKKMKGLLFGEMIDAQYLHYFLALFCQAHDIRANFIEANPVIGKGLVELGCTGTAEVSPIKFGEFKKNILFGGARCWELIKFLFTDKKGNEDLKLNKWSKENKGVWNLEDEDWPCFLNAKFDDNHFQFLEMGRRDNEFYAILKCSLNFGFTQADQEILTEFFQSVSKETQKPKFKAIKVPKQQSNECGPRTFNEIINLACLKSNTGPWQESKDTKSDQSNSRGSIINTESKITRTWMFLSIFRSLSCPDPASNQTPWIVDFLQRIAEAIAMVKSSGRSKKRSSSDVVVLSPPSPPQKRPRASAVPASGYSAPASGQMSQRQITAFMARCNPKDSLRKAPDDETGDGGSGSGAGGKGRGQSGGSGAKTASSNEGGCRVSDGNSRGMKGSGPADHQAPSGSAEFLEPSAYTQPSRRSSFDTGCWFCAGPDAQLVCTHDGCRIRYCCDCFGCECGNRCQGSPNFSCEMHRAMHGLKQTKPFKQKRCKVSNGHEPKFDSCRKCEGEAKCLHCQEQGVKLLECKDCGKRLCEVCAHATSVDFKLFKPKRSPDCKGQDPKLDSSRFTYTCFPCSSIGVVGILDSNKFGGRQQFIKARTRTVDVLCKQIFGTTAVESVDISKVKSNHLMTQTTLENAIALSRIASSMMKSGFEEAANSFIPILSKVLAAYQGTVFQPSAVLDLVYLIDGVNITWSTVEKVAAVQINEATAALTHSSMGGKEKSSKRNRKTQQRHAAVADASVESDTRFSSADTESLSAGTDRDEAILPVIVGFWSHDLTINSASLQLAYDVIMTLDGFSGGKFVVHVFSEQMSPQQPYDTANPLCNGLADHFGRQGRYHLFARNAPAQLHANTMKACQLHVLITLPGFNHGARNDVLLLRPAPIMIQWLGAAGRMCSPGLLDFIVMDRGTQTAATTASERQIVFDSLYPFPHVCCEMPLFDSIKEQFYELPAHRRRLCFGGTSDRIRESTILDALRCLADCGHGPESPVLCIMYMGSGEMLSSIMFWAQRWRKEFCPDFDLRRILPFRFIGRTEEWYAFIALMHLFIDCYPCGFHTSALEVMRLCKPFVGWRRPGAPWPSNVACAMLEYGNYDGALVAHSEEEYREKIVFLLSNEWATQLIEDCMREDLALGRGMYNPNRVVENFAVGIPAAIQQVRSQQNANIDITGLLPDVPKGGAAASSRLQLLEDKQKQRIRIRQDMQSTGRIRLIEEADAILKRLQLNGLTVISLAGTGASNHAFRTALRINGVSEEKRVILKILHGGRCKAGSSGLGCKVGELRKDPNIRSAHFMNAAERAFGSHPGSNPVVAAVPILQRSDGQMCAYGYLQIKTGDGSIPRAISFLCCEEMPSDLTKSERFQAWVREFHDSGIISRAHADFERALFQALKSLHLKGLYIMDISMGNLAVDHDGMPRFIDTDSSVVLVQHRGDCFAASVADGEAESLADSSVYLKKSTKNCREEFVYLDGDEIREVMTGTTQSDISGYGTRTCRCESMADELKSFRRHQRELTPEFAARYDVSSASMVLLQAYAPYPDSPEDRLVWTKMRSAVTQSQNSFTMLSFLRSGLAEGFCQEPLQAAALEQRADLFYRCLKDPWQNRPCAQAALDSFSL